MTSLAVFIVACLGATDRAELAGSLWFVGTDQVTWSAEQWATELDPIQRLGMNTLVLNGMLVGAPLKEGESDGVRTLFEEGDKRGLKFYVDTLAAANWWTLPNTDEEIARACARVKDLYARYGSYSSFQGFYIPYELYFFWDEKAALIRRLYGEIAKCCKEVAPTKSVMISPFFILDEKGVLGDFRWATPDEYRDFWKETLRQAPIDIVALQDSGEHLSCYTLEQRAPWFAAMKAACDATGKQLWANVETGELEVASLDDYVARFGLKTHVNDAKTLPAWRGVPADKLDAKLRFVRQYTPTAITWGYREFIRPSLGPNAAKLYEDYVQVLAKPAAK
jgi:hypothetical protein